MDLFYEIARGAFVIVALLFSILATLQTVKFLKNGTGVEANPLKIIQWLQRTFPTSWPWIKYGSTAAMLTIAWLLPNPISPIVLFILAFIAFLDWKTNKDNGF